MSCNININKCLQSIIVLVSLKIVNCSIFRHLLSLILKEMDEEKYIENVDYYMRVLTLLTDTEVNLINDCWNLVKTTEGFFEKIFYRMLAGNNAIRTLFVGLEDTSDEMLTKSKVFRDHNDQVVNSLSAIVEHIQSPNTWMLDVLRTATIHRLSAVKLSYFTDFKSMFMGELKNALGENFNTENEELWDRVLDCVVGFMNQCLDK